MILSAERVLTPATAETLASTAEWVESVAIGMGLQAQAAWQLGICALEAVNNSFEHAYGSRPGIITVRVHADPAQLTVTVTDRGHGLPQTPDVREPRMADERGRGTWIMHSWCDEVEYRIEHGLQSVRLLKRRAAAPTSYPLQNQDLPS